MVKITVCIGSSCHLKGSRQIVERFQYLIKESGKDDAVELERSVWANAHRTAYP